MYFESIVCQKKYRFHAAVAVMVAVIAVILKFYFTGIFQYMSF